MIPNIAEKYLSLTLTEKYVHAVILNLQLMIWNCNQLMILKAESVNIRFSLINDKTVQSITS